MATIDTLPAINVSGTYATLRFEILDDGSPDGYESWSVNIGIKLHSSDTWIWLDKLMGAGEGVRQQNVTGLSPDTQYDVISRISNSAGISYGDVETFSTQAQQQGLPFVTTLKAKSITSQSSELELLLNDDGDSSIVTHVDTRFVYWKDEEQPKATEWFPTGEGQQSSLIISGLEPSMTYWFYAEAKNPAGIVNGNTLSFKTLPDSNSVPIAFDSNEPDTLLIQNFINVLQKDPNNPHDNQGIVSYVEKKGNLATLDSNDIYYSNPKMSKASKIVSLIPEIKEKEELPGFYELSKDARPEMIDINDSNNLVLLELSIVSDSFPDANTTSGNSLKFWLPNDTNSIELNNSFNGKPLTLQQISTDPNEPNLVYPLWDIRSIIDENGRQLPLDKLSNQKHNIPYAFFELSTTKELLDINGDDAVSMEDYILLLEDFGKVGIFRSDIASEKSIGLPDGKVDEIDAVSFITKYNERYPEDPISNPYVESPGNFERGCIESPFTSSGDIPWIIDENPFSGNYCVKSGNINDSQISILETDIDSGTLISFYCRVSSENDFDDLTFYIDNVEAGRWSGQRDWEKVEFEIVPGVHNFKWIYSKDNSVSVGQDCAWIDNVEFSSY